MTAEATRTVTVRLLHNASIPTARWCEPVGWEPANVIEGSELAQHAQMGLTRVIGYTLDGCEVAGEEEGSALEIRQ